MTEAPQSTSLEAPAPAGRKRLWIALLAIALLVGLRFVALEADAPRSLTSWSVGLYVDEGYKTLDARNRVLFGSNRWHEKDDYGGWSAESPLTQWAFEGCFRLFGVRLGSARVVSIACFAVLLLGFLAAHHRRYTRPWLLLGLLLLGTQSTIFFFSRIAIFEFPMIVFLYLALFTLARSDRIGSLPSALILALSFCIATFGVKASGPIYFFPLGLGLLVSTLLRRGSQPTGLRAFAPFLALSALLGLALWFSRDWALEKFGLSHDHYGRVLFWSPMMYTATPLATMGVGCAFHALLVEPRRYLANGYRASLIALVLLGPLAISLLKYHPLRYFVPFFPAYVLLVIEWFQLRTWRSPVPRRLSVAALLGLIPVGAWFLASLELTVLRQALWQWHWLGAKLLRVLTPTVVLASGFVAAAVLLLFARRLLTGKIVLVTALAVQLMACMGDTRRIGEFLLDPQYRVREISRRIQEIVPENGSIGGTWAPVFTVNTSVRSLYMNLRINRPARLVFVRPDFLLVAGESDYYRRVKRRKDVIAGEPVYRTSYAGCEVLVVPLSYAEFPLDQE